MDGTAVGGSVIQRGGWELMKKGLIITVVTAGLFMLCFVVYLKVNPPISTGTIATGDDKHIAVVEVGNKGLTGIKVRDVLINHNQKPKKLRVQVSNPLNGFMITDSFDDIKEEYGVRNLESVTIQPKTSPQMQLDKMNNGTATEKDHSYGISIVDDEPIETVIIEYRHFGIPFVKTISID